MHFAEQGSKVDVPEGHGKLACSPTIPTPAIPVLLLGGEAGTVSGDPRICLAPKAQLIPAWGSAPGKRFPRRASAEGATQPMVHQSHT